MAKILLVEDDPVLGKGLKVNLEIDGYLVCWEDSISSARSRINSESFDLIIQDLNLPDGSGLGFVQECRASHVDLPILILTASNDEDSVVAGFDAGAVDYVRKPFSSKELKARLKVILKEKSRKIVRPLQYDEISIYPDKRIVRIGENKLDLNRREFDILSYFVSNAENVVTRESLLSFLNREGEIFDRTIDSHVSHLRASLRKAGVTTVQISPVYGVGYRLEKKI